MVCNYCFDIHGKIVISFQYFLKLVLINAYYLTILKFRSIKC